MRISSDTYRPPDWGPAIASHEQTYIDVPDPDPSANGATRKQRCSPGVAGIPDSMACHPGDAPWHMPSPAVALSAEQFQFAWQLFPEHFFSTQRV